MLEKIYSNTAIMIHPLPDYSTASEPAIILIMLDYLQVEPGQRILEIGTGSGWNTALLACGVGTNGAVSSVEINPSLASAAMDRLRRFGFQNVWVKAGDGGYGYPENSPYDRIIVTVGAHDIPPAWIDQLVEGGMILIPFTMRGIGSPLLRLRKAEGRVRGKFVRYSTFMDLRGAFASELQKDRASENMRFGEELAKSEVRLEVDLSDWNEPVTSWLFFSWFRGWRFDRYGGKRDGFQSVRLVDSRAKLLLETVLEHRKTYIRGDERAVSEFSSFLNEWRTQGSSTMQDCDVELLRVFPSSVEAGTWVEQRENAVLKISVTATRARQ